MRKIGYLILGLSLLWLAKLSYDVAQYSQTVPQLQQQLSQTEQRYALLNDQFVAVQRQLQNNRVVEPTDNSSIPMTVEGISPIILIKQQMQLVQFALDQQQFIYALEQLNQAQQQVLQYTVSPALQDSLIKSIEQDKQAIQQFILSQTQQQQQLDQLLQQLDQKIAHNLQDPKLSIEKGESATWWHWFKLEKVQRSSPDLMGRNITLKEAQLRLLLASQALHEGQLTEYQKSVQEVIRLLAELPDQNSQQMKLRLEKILNQQAVPTPKLTSLGLLG